MRSLLALVLLVGLLGAGLLALGARAARVPPRATIAGPEPAPGPLASMLHLPAETAPKTPATALVTSAQPAAEIEGRVLGPTARVTGLEVLARPLGAPARPLLSRCDAEGRFTFTGLEPARRYELAAIPAGRASDARPRSFPLTVLAGARTVELVLRPEASLRFRVVEAGSGAAIEDLEVRLGQAFLRPLLDQEGKVRRRFPAGWVEATALLEAETGSTLALQVLAPGFRTEERGDLFVPRGGELDIGELRLERVARLVVTVLDARSTQPLGGALVVLALPGSTDEPPLTQSFDPHRGRTDTAGRVLLTSLPVGEAVLRVQAPTRAALELPLQLLALEEQRETVRVP